MSDKVKTCPDCEGSGDIGLGPERPCPTCGGAGVKIDIASDRDDAEVSSHKDEYTLDDIVDALASPGLVNMEFELKEPMKLVVVYGDGYRRRPFIGGEMFRYREAKIGKKGNVIFCFAQVDGDQEVEMSEKEALQKLKGFYDNVVLSVGMEWDMARSMAGKRRRVSDGEKFIEAVKAEPVKTFDERADEIENFGTW